MENKIDLLLKKIDSDVIQKNKNKNAKTSLSPKELIDLWNYFQQKNYEEDGIPLSQETFCKTILKSTINRNTLRKEINNTNFFTEKKYNPTSVEGYLGLQLDNYQKLINNLGVKLELLPESLGNYFKITLENGSVIEVLRNSSPAVAFIFINKKNIATIDNPTEIFANNLADLVNKYYSDYISIENTEEKTYN